MSNTALIQKFQSEVELTPVAGSSSLHTIHPLRTDDTPEETAMTEGDWDKFEEDIHEAFEQTP